MSHYVAEASAIIPAAPAAVYGVLKDYHVGHPAIVPKRYFKELKVLEGGDGAGTIFETRIRIMGSERTFRMRVTEPQPGSILQEEDEPTGIKTTFIVEPVNGGEECQLTIRSRARTSPGLLGLIEKMLTPPLLRRIYRAELKELTHYLRHERI